MSPYCHTFCPENATRRYQCMTGDALPCFLDNMSSKSDARPPPLSCRCGETAAGPIDATSGRDTREALREINQDAIPRTTGVAVKA